VQGRITNGTLFPRISAKIQASIELLTEKVFVDLQNAANTVLADIARDVEMALASGPRHVDSATKKEKPEEVKRKKDLGEEITRLKIRHEEILATISEL
jgi:hypothetical protein